MSPVSENQVTRSRTPDTVWNHLPPYHLAGLAPERVSVRTTKAAPLEQQERAVANRFADRCRCCWATRASRVDEDRPPSRRRDRNSRLLSGAGPLRWSRQPDSPPSRGPRAGRAELPDGLLAE